MTYQELLVAARNAWTMGQDASTRELFLMRPKPDETTFDFEKRQNEAAQAIPKLDGWIVLMQQEPLVASAMRTQAGITSITVKGGTIPVPKVVLLDDGTPDLTRAEETLANFVATFPPHSDFQPTACPFQSDWPYNRAEDLWGPLDDDKTPIMGTWTGTITPAGGYPPRTGTWVKVLKGGFPGGGLGVPFYKG